MDGLEEVRSCSLAVLHLHVDVVMRGGVASSCLHLGEGEEGRGAAGGGGDGEVVEGGRLAADGVGGALRSGGRTVGVVEVALGEEGPLLVEVVVQWRWGQWRRMALERMDGCAGQLK